MYSILDERSYVMCVLNDGTTIMEVAVRGFSTYSFVIQNITATLNIREDRFSFFETFIQKK